MRINNKHQFCFSLPKNKDKKKAPVLCLTDKICLKSLQREKKEHCDGQEILHHKIGDREEGQQVLGLEDPVRGGRR